ncbi:MAG: FecR domain-containing protein [Bacteroidota bacterium]
MKDKYTTYQAEDFAQDDSFIRWVKGQDARATAFWDAWQKAHPERSAELEAGRRLVEAIRMKGRQPTEATLSGIWDKIDAQTAKEAPVVQMRRRKSLRWISYAAAACVAALMFFWLYNPSTIVRSNAAGQELVQLPDNSSVQLNADSELRYQAGSWEENRLVELEGEAFFEVQKGSRFTVQTPLGIVEVLGTSFNVYARGAAFEVHCLTGKVRVQAESGKEVFLTPGQFTRLDADQELLPASSADGERRASWRSGQFYFDNGKVKDVFEEIQRQYGVTIAADESILAKSGSYFFNTSDPIDTTLYKICWPMNLKAQKSGGVYRIVAE